jgi:hypothetical protein
MKEFRICLPTQAGQLAQVSEGLANRSINILTLAAVQMTNLSTAVGIVVSSEQEEETRIILQGLGLHCEERELLRIQLQNVPGKLAELSKNLASKHINIESIYFLGNEEGGEDLVISVDNLAQAREALKELIVER